MVLTERDLVGGGTGHGQQDQEHERRGGEGGHSDAPSGDDCTHLQHDDGATASL